MSALDQRTTPELVQVRAIPTASVPVIKVLADPSKLEGIHNQHLAEQAAAVAGKNGVPIPQSVADDYPQSSLLPWRGSDVMNGLLSLDITFEGGEHGGLWSTEFSAVVVSQICAQAGLHPDATPFVQTLMVLKELLAQRKLNESYSGGLSSYALLLLLLALVNERQVIREDGSFQSIVCNHVTDVDGNNRAGMRWYELRNYGNGWQIYQQSSYAPNYDDASPWMAAIAINEDQSIGLAYNISSNTFGLDRQ